MAVTRYEYDDAGRLVGSWVEREPEWSRADVEALVALLESRRVGAHGFALSEATSRDGDPSNPEREWDWHVPLPTFDFAQAALDREKKRYLEAYPDADFDAMLWRVEKRPV